MIAELDETPGQLVLATGYLENPSFLPKSGIPVETLERIRAWAVRRIGADAPVPEPVALPDAPVRLTYALDAGDCAAVVTRQRALPAEVRRRRIGFAILLIGFSLVVPALFAFAWVVDPERVPFDIAFPLYLRMFGDLFWQPAAIVVVFFGLCAFFYTRLRARSDRLWGLYVHERARPGEFHVAIDAQGLRSMMGGSHAHWTWGALKGFERTETHLFFPIRCGMVIPLPLRAFDAAALAETTSLAARHLSPKLGEPA